MRRRPLSFGWTWIWRSVLLRRRHLVRLVAMTAVIYAMGLVFPIAAQKAVDAVASGKGSGAITALAGLTLVAIAIEAVLSRSRQTLVTGLASVVDRRIARRLYAHLLRISVDGLELRTGEMMNRFQYARKIQSFVLNDVPRLVFEVGSAIASLVLMFRYDLVVAGVTLACAPAVVLLVRSPLATLTDFSLTYYKVAGEQQNVLAETVSHIEAAKILGIESMLMRRWSTVTDRMIDALARLTDYQRRFFVTSQVASRVIALIVVVAGCIQLVRHAISIGDLLALQILANKVTGPLLQSSDLYGRYQEVDTGIGALREFFAEPRETAAASPPRRILAAGGIALHGTSLRYRGAQRSALREVDLQLPETGVVAIVGRNGSGKSTFLRLLLGLVEPSQGHVEYGGCDLKSYDPRWLRGQIGVVQQDIVLFSGTVRAAVNGSRPSAREDETRGALAFAGALDFVDALPDGLETMLDNNGATLSGGQRQRLSIARAVIRDPRIAFFDEPTAFLDPEAAVQLERHLMQWGRERLLVVVTHHLASVQGADRILVFDDGRIVGDGTHRELIEGNPAYISLWENYTRRGYEPGTI